MEKGVVKSDRLPVALVDEPMRWVGIRFCQRGEWEKLVGRTTIC